MASRRLAVGDLVAIDAKAHNVSPCQAKVRCLLDWDDMVDMVSRACQAVPVAVFTKRVDRALPVTKPLPPAVIAPASGVVAGVASLASVSVSKWAKLLHFLAPRNDNRDALAYCDAKGPPTPFCFLACESRRGTHGRLTASLT